MATPPSATSLNVENIVFPSSVKPPGCTNTLFLGGAGVRGMEIQGNFVKFTGIGVYLEDKAISFLAGKWKGKTAEELVNSVEFFRDIVTGCETSMTVVCETASLIWAQHIQTWFDFLEGLSYLQNNMNDKLNVIHRDIKSAKSLYNRLKALSKSLLR